MAQSLEIKTANPQFAMAISEGANAVELRVVKEEIKRLNAMNGVRQEAENKRWKRTKRRLARKYTVRHVGRVEGVLLGTWGLMWYSAAVLFRYLQRWNRGA